MIARRIGATLMLAAACALVVRERPELLAYLRRDPAPADPRVAEVRRILDPVLANCTTTQRTELASFYRSAAQAVPKLARHDSSITNSRMRSILELAVRIHFADEWQAVPGLANAIHGPDGAIARLYGLDQGPLDANKFAQTLAAIANACEP